MTTLLLFVALVSSAPAPLTSVSHAVALAAQPYVQFTGGVPATRSSASGRTIVAYAGHAACQTGPRRGVAESPDVVVCLDGTPVSGAPESRAWDAVDLRDRWDAADELEGQFAAVRVDLRAGEITCRQDPLGLGPLYAGKVDGGWVVGNSVRAVRALVGASEPDPLGVAGFITLGWTVAGRTTHRSVGAVPRGHRCTYRANSLEKVPDFTPELVLRRARDETPHHGDTERLGADLVELARGALTQPGVPTSCGVTAGRDSRLLLALGLAAGARPRTLTIGDDGDPDVETGRRLAYVAGLEHTRVPPTPADTDKNDDVAAAAQSFVALTDGCSSLLQLHDVHRLPHQVERVGIQGWGVGGEIARGGTGALSALATCGPVLRRSVGVQRMLLALKARDPASLLREEARRQLSDYLRAFVQDRLDEGWPAREVSEVFYAFERVACWGSAGVRRSSPADDVFSPFTSRAFVVHALSLSSDKRYAEIVHRRLLHELAPELVRLPFDGPWRVRHPRLAPAHAAAQGAVLLAGRVRSALRRTTGGGGPTPWSIEWFGRHRDELRQLVLDGPDGLWSVMDRTATERAFAGDRASADDVAEGLLRATTIAIALRGE